MNKKEIIEILKHNFSQRSKQVDNLISNIRDWPEWPSGNSDYNLSRKKVDSVAFVVEEHKENFIEIATSFINDTYAPNREGTIGKKFLEFYFPLVWFNSPDWEIGLSYFQYRMNSNPKLFLASIKGYIQRYKWLHNWQKEYKIHSPGSLWLALDSIALDQAEFAESIIESTIDIPKDQRFGTLFHGISSLLSLHGPEYPKLETEISDKWFEHIRKCFLGILKFDSKIFSSGIEFLYATHRKKHNIPWDSHTAFWDLSVIATNFERIALSKGLSYSPSVSDVRDETLINSPSDPAHSSFCYLPGADFLLHEFRSGFSWLSALVGESITQEQEKEILNT